MAFKRVADDFDDFKLQKKRRVNDLLLGDIPSDEAILTKNGKLACLVCHHRPMLDTTAVLSLHRQGKKHLANSAIRLEKAKQYAELKQKREHEQYLSELEKQEEKRSNSSAPLLGLTNKSKELALTGALLASKWAVTESPMETSQRGVIRQCPGETAPFFQPRTMFNATNNGILTSTKPEKEGVPSIAGACNHEKLTNDSRSRTSTYPERKKEKTVTQIQTTKPYSNTDEQARKKLRSEYLARKRCQGWIMGTDGCWYRDEEVEFDSDEEDPPPPPNL